MDKSSLSDPFDFCLAQSLGAHRTRMARGDMTVAHARHLLETYPGLFRHAHSPAVDASPRFARDGFACGDGWFSILDRLSAKLVADPNLVVVQCKEKMGILAMYFEDGPATITMFFDGGSATLVEVEAATEVSATRAALEAAVKDSAVTCELCGQPSPGPQTNVNHWVTVRCDSCGWLDDMVLACGFLSEIAAVETLEAFAADIGAVVMSKNHITRHLGVGAAHQPEEVRKRFPAIDWAKLDLWATIDSTDKMEQAQCDFTKEELEAMIFQVSPEDIWKFIHEDVPVIKEALW
jgi:uncharacterized protein with HEPN domain